MSARIAHRSVPLVFVAGLIAALLGGVATAPPPAAAATTFVVDNTTDNGALSACTLAPGDCSLRGAVAAANATPGEDAIHFLIPAVQCPGGICPITLTAGPIVITEAVTIDGTTQVQNSGPKANVCATATEPSHMRIEVVTDPAGGDSTGFTIDHATGASTVRGIAIGTNQTVGTATGINVTNGSGHHLACNHLGVNAAGNALLGSAWFDSVVGLDTADNVIIGTDGDGVDDLAERNVVASPGFGVYVNNDDGTRISGNYFGFTADGATALSTGIVFVRQASSNTLIGVDEDGVSDDLEVNYFGGGSPVLFYPDTDASSDNHIVGNVVGMGPTGAVAALQTGITLSGLGLDDTGYEIRDNVVVGAGNAALDISGIAGEVLVEANWIGMARDGTGIPNVVGIHLGSWISPQVTDNLVFNSFDTGIELTHSASFEAGSTGNCIVDNTAGVVSYTGFLATFTDNWWGAIDGPSGAGPGSGDSVSTGVAYIPWSTSPGVLCNTAPAISDSFFELAETAPIGTVVGTVPVDDDGADLSFAITAGNDEGAFAIDVTTGEITTAAALDYETTSSFVLTVVVDDGQYSDTGSVDITVTDVVEPPPGPSFDDVPETHTFYSDIEWLAAQGITRGCNPPDNSLYCPDASVTRGQMAAFLHRALGATLTPGTTVSFTDIAGSVFATDIEWLGGVGITKGCNPPTNDMFCPNDVVTRGQMAAFLVRAMGYTAGAGSDQFTDDDGSIFEADIERLAEAGVTRGCNPPTNDMFCPSSPVTRAQMAAFLHRALGG